MRMSLTYLNLSKRPQVFKRMTGVSLLEFEEIISRIRSLWDSSVESLKKPQGRVSVLKTLEDKLMALLIYYRTYITHEFLGHLCGLHNSNICRLFKKLEPLLGKRLAIKKDRTLTPEVVLKILVDVTEQPIQRPQKAGKRKQTYSGKKKRHTRKTEMVMQEDGKITSVSKSHGGRKHDFKIRKEETLLPVKSEKYADSGYQGLQKIASFVTLPFKRKKGQSLTCEQKHHNRRLASFRIKIEHKFREIKIFKVMSEIYRNFGKKHHLRFNIIAGIVNLKHGF
jgi:DDE superfamily endonuclease/Helix-turn-helix of DDE superfamily endonuclease